MSLATPYFEIITTERTLIKLYFIILYFNDNVLFPVILIFCMTINVFKQTVYPINAYIYEVHYTHLGNNSYLLLKRLKNKKLKLFMCYNKYTYMYLASGLARFQLYLFVDK